MIDSAVNGLAAALVSGVVGLVTFFLTRRARRSQIADAWREQAEEIARRLHQQYRDQISYLRRENAAKDTEIRRLNKILTDRERP